VSHDIGVSTHSNSCKGTISMTIYCQQCNQPIKSKSAKKFCGSSCAATYNNKGVRRHGTSPNTNECMNCKNPVTAKYCNTACQKEYEWKQRIHKVEAGLGSSKNAKRYLLETKGHCCNKCGNSEWNDQPIPIELEHIDGNSENNSIDNLELLCPNCHAQTPTYKGANRGKGRHYRRQRYNDGLSY
jgi:hypothetical protein